MARECARSDGRDSTQYHIVVDGEELPRMRKRVAIRTMVEQLARRRVPLPDIVATMGQRAIRVLDGTHRDGEAVRAALLAQHQRADAGRWFCDHALIDEATGKTYVVTKMWGIHTESNLAALVAAFPEAKVTFRRADLPEE